ncbi:MAG: 5-oxoprolinase subunit PxpB [Thermomicrobiales bacterium]
MSELAIAPLAESALLVRLTDEERIDPAMVARAAALADSLAALAIPGVIDIVPAYITVMVSFDPRQVDPGELSEQIEQLAGAAADQPSGRLVTIPIAYGGAFGPDLDDVAAHAGLSPEDVIARHAGGNYSVGVMGFAPGWAYLLGLPPELAMPRLSNPRLRIPPGSLGIGGEQTGIYPLATPGGWRLIGRTPLRMFNPARHEPFLLKPGDRVRFEPISEVTFFSMEGAAAVGRRGPETELSDE